MNKKSCKRNSKCRSIIEELDKYREEESDTTAQLIILQKPLFYILCLTPTPITHTKMSQNNLIRSIILLYDYEVFYKISDLGALVTNERSQHASALFCIIYLLFINKLWHRQAKCFNRFTSVFAQFNFCLIY